MRDCIEYKNTRTTKTTRVRNHKIIEYEAERWQTADS